jgi:3'-phosphoadenosine 5'-phosphosulfate (PAPS) 3'-phosphatase
VEHYQKQAFSNDTLIAIEAALQAGDILRQGYGTAFTISHKEGQHNLVTEYDYKAEKSIISFLKSHVPNSQFLAEESGFTGEASENLWVIFFAELFISPLRMNFLWQKRGRGRFSMERQSASLL